MIPKTKRGWIGLLLHIPVGLFIVFCFAFGISTSAQNCSFNPEAVVGILVGLILWYSFLRYEEVQGGGAHLDIKGLCWGLVFGIIGYMVYAWVF